MLRSIHGGVYAADSTLKSTAAIGGMRRFGALRFVASSLSWRHEAVRLPFAGHGMNLDNFRPLKLP